MATHKEILSNPDIIRPNKWVTAPLLYAITGYSRSQVYRKRATEEWVNGVHYKRDPHGQWMYNMDEINAWIEECRV